MNDLISIVIPAYNAAAFVAKTLDTILAQTYQNFEVVIINDGSKDNTLEILEAYAKKDKRIRVFSQENGGVSAARNTALTKIKGQYITYIDADDSVPPTALADLMALMADDVDLVVGSHDEIRIGKRHHLEKVNTLQAEELAEKFRQFDPVVWWPWGKLFRASVIFDNHLTYDTSITFGEDHIFNLLYGKHMTGKMVVTDKVVYNYHYIRGGLCSKYYPNMNELQKYVYYKIEDFFDGHDTTPYEIRVHYSGAYLKGLVDYYAAWLPFSKAVEKVKESFDMYSDITDAYTLKAFFTPAQYALLESGDFAAFTKQYIKDNPRKTTVRKFRRSIRKTLEFGQKVFLKRK